MFKVAVIAKKSIAFVNIPLQLHHKIRDGIRYPFPNSNAATAEVWEWISNFIPYLTGRVITNP